MVLLYYRNLYATPVGNSVLYNISANINNNCYSTYIKSDKELKYLLNLNQINSALIQSTENKGISNEKPVVDYSSKDRSIDLKNKKFVSKFNTITKAWEYLKATAEYPYTSWNFSITTNYVGKDWKGYIWFTNFNLLQNKGYTFPDNLIKSLKLRMEWV